MVLCAGRGTADDKRFRYRCTFAMKAIKDAGITPKKTIKLIAGPDEETGKESCHPLQRKEELMPDFGITPDADFPVLMARRGFLYLISHRSSRSFYSEGRAHVEQGSWVDWQQMRVPAHARAVIASDERRARYDDIIELQAII